MNSIEKFIIVDDDEINNIICKMAIENVLHNTDIATFEVPEDALSFIKGRYNKKVEDTILLLDINMPTITGWEFLKQYEKFNDKVKKQISIYILSSSVDPRDKDAAEGNKYVKGFLSKPLENETIIRIATT